MFVFSGRSLSVSFFFFYSIQNTFIAKIEVQLAQGPKWGSQHSGEGQMIGMCLTREVQRQK